MRKSNARSFPNFKSGWKIRHIFLKPTTELTSRHESTELHSWTWPLKVVSLSLAECKPLWTPGIARDLQKTSLGVGVGFFCWRGFGVVGVVWGGWIPFFRARISCLSFFIDRTRFPKNKQQLDVCWYVSELSHQNPEMKDSHKFRKVPANLPIGWHPKHSCYSSSSYVLAK